MAVASHFNIESPVNKGKYTTNDDEYLALEDGPPIFRQDYTCPALLFASSVPHRSFHVRGYHPLWPPFPERSVKSCAITCRLFQFRCFPVTIRDVKNRQNSIENTDEELQNWFDYQVYSVQSTARQVCEEALKRGIAKEQARCVLPEGLTVSKMYMTGTIRSWKHYVDLRSGNGTQKEHQLIAQAIGQQLKEELPNLF